MENKDNNIDFHLSDLFSVRNFIKYLVEIQNVRFDWDGDFHQYVRKDGTKAFTDSQAHMYNEYLADAKAICKNRGVSLFNVYADVMEEIIMRKLSSQSKIEKP